MSLVDAVLATISAEGIGGLKGRTLLQKKLYFLSVLSQESFNFVPHYYGPYSTSIADTLGALVSAGIVDEQKDVYQTTGIFGEYRRYTYKISRSAKKVSESRSVQIAPYGDFLKKINNHQISNDPDLMAVAAKVYLIVAEKKKATKAEIRQRAKELNWELDDPKINLVVGYLEHLGLVRSPNNT